MLNPANGDPPKSLAWSPRQRLFQLIFWQKQDISQALNPKAVLIAYLKETLKGTINPKVIFIVSLKETLNGTLNPKVILETLTEPCALNPNA